MNTKQFRSRGWLSSEPSTHAPTRRLRAAAATAASTLVLALGFAVSAQANLAGSTFEGNDGDLVATGANTDWANVAGRALGVDIASKTTDDAFGQGTKEDNAAVTIVDGSIPPNKNNLSRFYEADEQVSTGDIMLYLAWERLVNIGNANLDFEINKNSTVDWTSSTQGPVTINRTAGDLLITYDFNGQGTPTLGLNTWLTADNGNTASQCFAANSLPCWGEHVTLQGTNSEGAVNTTTVNDPIGPNAPGDLGAGLFGEAAINLSDAGVFTPGVCKAFGSAFVKSRSSSSFTAELKDFIAPVDVSISNCSSIKIVKKTENAPSGDTTSFSYTTTGTGLSDFSLKSGENKLFENLNAGTYTVTEGKLPAGWDLKSLACTGGSDATGSGAVATINLALAENVVCTYTNHYTNSPTIKTTLSATSIVAGGQVHDSAALTGATATAGGTVTYRVYTNNTCDSLNPIDAGTKTVLNGAVPDSDSITFTTAGDYYWQAAYSGDTNNNAAKSACTEEHLLVKTAPTIGTVLQQDVINVGDTVYDTATLTGATSDAGGTVTYHAYAGQNTCSGTDLMPAGTQTVDVTNGVVPNSPAIKIDTAGYYSFQAVYSGDTKNDGATSVCSTEQLLVMTLPSISTLLSATSVNIGDLVTDSATLSNASADAGGTVTYSAYAGQNTCTGTDLLNSVKTVTKGVVPDSDAVSFAASGWYSFQAVYSGDTKNNGAKSVCSTEQLLVKTNPEIATALSATTINVGDSVTDSATLSSMTSDAGGTVTYHAYAGQNTCTGTDLLNYEVAVTNGSVPDSKSIKLDAGYYSFQAVYSGDAKNNGATSECTTEQLLVKTLPSISTLLSATTVNIGDPVTDSATLSGASSDAGGTVTYSAYAGQNTCTGTDLLNSVKTVTKGVVPDSHPVSFNASGYYSFQAVYSGDTKNNGAKSECTTEQLLVKTNPAISTILSATSVDVGSFVYDSSQLSSMTSDASGTVIYTVYTDNQCTQGARDAGTVTVNNGVVPDSDALQFNTAGTYYWQAIYSGDDKNNGAKSTCTDETLVVNPLQPTASTAQNVIPNDAFTLGDGFNPTGSITFNLYSPSDPTCAGDPALTQTVTVSGNGTYNTTNNSFVASAEGTWRWASSYTGDTNNKSASSTCGVENFTITNN